MRDGPVLEAFPSFPGQLDRSHSLDIEEGKANSQVNHLILCHLILMSSLSHPNTVSHPVHWAETSPGVPIERLPGFDLLCFLNIYTSQELPKGLPVFSFSVMSKACHFKAQRGAVYKVQEACTTALNY